MAQTSLDHLDLDQSLIARLQVGSSRALRTRGANACARARAAILQAFPAAMQKRAELNLNPNHHQQSRCRPGGGTDSFGVRPLRLGKLDLGGQYAAGAGGLDVRNRVHPAPRGCWPRYRSVTVDVGRPDLWRTAGGVRCGLDVRRGPISGEFRRRPGAPRDDGVVVTRSAKCRPSLQRRCRRRRLRPPMRRTHLRGSHRGHG